MDKKVAGFLGAAVALTTVTAAQATSLQPAPVGPAASYADLLQPIPNALVVLRADDVASSPTDSAANLERVQYYHHHHHRYYRRHHHHHHHHHYFE